MIALSTFMRGLQTSPDGNMDPGLVFRAARKYSSFSGGHTQARQEWSRVQELQGDLKGAAEAAGKALAETTP